MKGWSSYAGDWTEYCHSLQEEIKVFEHGYDSDGSEHTPYLSLMVRDKTKRTTAAQAAQYIQTAMACQERGDLGEAEAPFLGSRGRLHFGEGTQHLSDQQRQISAMPGALGGRTRATRRTGGSGQGGGTAKRYGGEQSRRGGHVCGGTGGSQAGGTREKNAKGGEEEEQQEARQEEGQKKATPE